MEFVSADQIIAFWLHRHHLYRKLPLKCRLEAVSCGILNSPPGSWETAMFNRVEGITLAQCRQDLEADKTVLQAWSLRGVPTVYPQSDSNIFLGGLQAEPGEMEIYAQGLPPTLKALELTQTEVLTALMQACAILDQEVILSKQQLDQRLAREAEKYLASDQLRHWRDPSLVAAGQTLGEAAVSYLLRACARQGKVSFASRQGNQAAFCSLSYWMGTPVSIKPDPFALVRRFLSAYGPSTREGFCHWSGCEIKQGRRLWQSAEEDMLEVRHESGTGWILKDDISALLGSQIKENRLCLLGPHDPYLDIFDRALILPEKKAQKRIWRLVGSPGAIVVNGRIAGQWNARLQGRKMIFTAQLWTALNDELQAQLHAEALRLAAFRERTLEEKPTEMITL